MSFDKPILFLVFNRPLQTMVVFDTIRAQQPSRLYIAADGPRAHKPGEKELCEETRKAVLEAIDWPCDVRTLLRDENLGCGKAVSSAINWFFYQEEDGIILEDDCVPDPTFFSFCASMLDRFKEGAVYVLCQALGIRHYPYWCGIDNDVIKLLFE